MEQSIHGGDIYNKNIIADFSVNINPLGTSEKIKSAIIHSVTNIENYPQYDSNTLKNHIADIFKIEADQVVVTAGASEAFLAICHSRLYSSGVVVCPSFYGYEYALDAMNAMIMGILRENLLAGNLDEDYEVLFIANPNNPTGLGYSHDDMLSIIDLAAEKGMDVVVDECFLPLTYNEADSIIYDIKDNPLRFSHVFVVRSFTKTFAMPGIRLGYIVTADSFVADDISSHLPEWNISVVAQEAGLAALDCIGELDQARALIEKERKFLTEVLLENGFGIIESEANFILFHGPDDLGDRLYEKGILIRDCSNFVGLEKGDYRIAIRCHEDNIVLKEALEQIHE